MRKQCRCELGGDCDKTTVCALNNAVEECEEHLQAVTDAAIVYVHNLLAEHHGQGKPHHLKNARKNLIEEVEAYEMWEKNL